MEKFLSFNSIKPRNYHQDSVKKIKCKVSFLQFFSLLSLIFTLYMIGLKSAHYTASGDYLDFLELFFFLDFDFDDFSSITTSSDSWSGFVLISMSSSICYLRFLISLQCLSNIYWGVSLLSSWYRSLMYLFLLCSSFYWWASQ